MSIDRIKTIASLSMTEGDEQQARELIARLLDQGNLTPFEKAVTDSLCIRFGLYPYVRDELSSLDIRESLAIEMHRPRPEGDREASKNDSPPSNSMTLHAGQMEIFNRLMDGENVILSAPTSFGKSAIIGPLIQSMKWNNIVIIVPTIALIDETRRRLEANASNYRFVTSYTSETKLRNVYVLTQERFLEFRESPKVDLFIIDEFYKLSNGGTDDPRRAMLNIAWDRLYRTGAQYYLIGPNIEGLSAELPETILKSFTQSHFRPVAVDIEDRSSCKSPLEDLILFLRSLQHQPIQPTLIYSRTPKTARELAGNLALSAAGRPSDLALQVADWLKENYSTHWSLPYSLEKGIGIHSGPMPRAVQRLMIRLFNERHIPVLVCTSTLIEGANTAARNVIIFDGVLNRKPLDFFTFSNIQGRAGRMFQHYVGKVISYSPPPASSETIVDIPITSQSSEVSSSELLQLDSSRLRDDHRERVREIQSDLTLPSDVLKNNVGIDPSLQIATAKAMEALSGREKSLLSWAGLPTSEQKDFTLTFAFRNVLRSSARAGMNPAMLLSKIRACETHARDFNSLVMSQMGHKWKGQTNDDLVEHMLNFRRNWLEFTVPSMLRVLQSIQNSVLHIRHGYAKANYEVFTQIIESSFLPPVIKKLDEFGLPEPVALKLLSFASQEDDPRAFLHALGRFRRDPALIARTTPLERWIIDDALAGIGFNRQ